MVLTEEFFKKYTNCGLSFNKKQAEALGIAYPLQPGWKKTLIGKEISIDAAKRFKDAGAIATKRYIYVLELHGGKYYIGQTTTRKRIEDHKKGKGSAWSKKHGVVSVLEEYEIPVESHDHAELIENMKTIQYMNQHGWKNVRGGFWTNTDDMAHLRGLLAHVEGLKQCGANFINDIIGAQNTTSI